MNLHPAFAEALRPFAPAQSSVHHEAPKLPSFTGWVGDDIKVTVTYEYTPAEKPVYDVDSPVCGPGHDAEVEVIEVLLNGVDIRDVLADSVIESLEEQAFARVSE